jgi:hypothetical protein
MLVGRLWMGLLVLLLYLV